MDIDLSVYNHHLDPGALRALLHHGHWIPVRRGITQRYIEETYPGWSWNSLLDLLEGAGVVHKRDDPWKHPGYVPDRLLESVHFNRSGRVCAVWIDGSATVR